MKKAREVSRGEGLVKRITDIKRGPTMSEREWGGGGEGGGG